MTQKELIAAMDSWLAGKKSPMAGYSDFMVILARHVGIASALSVAVAQAETQCGTDPNADHADIVGHNAWGYGQSPNVAHGYLFPSWPDGINAVTERLGQLFHGADPLFPTCNTVTDLSGIWVNGDVDKPDAQWTANVTAILTKFGGDPNHIAKAPLTPAGGGTPPA